jgi:thiosulfate dehydrogenase [quinone] large subunit
MAERPRRRAPPGRARLIAPVAPAVALFPLRLFLGATFLYAGVQKLSDPGYLTRGSATYIGTQLEQFARGTPGGFILRALAIPHPVLAGVATALLELLVGLLVLAGWLTRGAAVVGLLLNLLLFLTNSWNTHPYFLGSDIVFVFAWLTLALAGAAGQPAVDTWLAARHSREWTGGGASRAGGVRTEAGAAPPLTRRAVLGVGMGIAGAATAALAGVSLLIRSQRRPATVTRTSHLGGDGSAVATTPPARTTSTGAGAGASSPTSGASRALPRGAVRLAASSRLAPGQAAVYRDPVDHSPDIVVRASNGTISALSAICTHAGCQCVYQPGSSGPELYCPCHGSRFDAVSGDVIQGPAVQPLPKRQVIDRAGSLYAVPARS